MLRVSRLICLVEQRAAAEHRAQPLFPRSLLEVSSSELQTAPRPRSLPLPRAPTLFSSDLIFFSRFPCVSLLSPSLAAERHGRATDTDLLRPQQQGCMIERASAGVVSCSLSGVYNAICGSSLPGSFY